MDWDPLAFAFLQRPCRRHCHVAVLPVPGRLGDGLYLCCTRRIMQGNS